jgi:hypothetical protein
MTKILLDFFKKKLNDTNERIHCKKKEEATERGAQNQSTLLLN